MLIKVNITGQGEEWTILEFQGTFVGEFDGEELGELHLESGDDVRMDIGRHTLKGKVGSSTISYTKPMFLTYFMA